MAPSDLYDLMLETIQQFPLEANCFERDVTRNNKEYQLYLKAYRRVLRRMPNPKSHKYRKAHKKLEKTLEERKKIIKRYNEQINKHLETIKEYNKVNEVGIRVEPFEELKVAAIKVDECETKKRCCICQLSPARIMIRCGNELCNVKWYHMNCMDLSEVPTESWRCNKCKIV